MISSHPRSQPSPPSPPFYCIARPTIRLRSSLHPALRRRHRLPPLLFLPYYAALDALPFLYHPPLFNSSALHGCDLADFLHHDRPAIWGQHCGHDHFPVLARLAWDFSQHPTADPPLWGTSFLHLPNFLNITVLSLEAHPCPRQETFSALPLRLSLFHQERAMPHPTSFHPIARPLVTSSPSSPSSIPSSSMSVTPPMTHPQRSSPSWSPLVPPPWP